jgi:F-type H+-transporting ATPase subunit a
LAFTGFVVALLTFGRLLVPRRLPADAPILRRQNLLEVIVFHINRQIHESASKILRTICR